MPKRPFALLMLAACGREPTPAGSSATETGGAASSGEATGSDVQGDEASTTGAGESSPPSDAEGSTSSGLASTGATEDTGPTDGTGADCDPRPGATLYAERDYEVEDPEDLFVEPVATASYLVGECWQDSNCWQVNPVNSGGDEDHAGWITAELPRLEQGGTASMFVGHLFYASSGILALMEDPGLGGKMLDAYMYSPVDDILPSRQSVIWSYWDHGLDPSFVDTAAIGIVPRLLKGGAGGNYVRQRGPVQFDLRDYPDQWIWMEYEFNAAERYTALWIKTLDGQFDGAYCNPLMFRSADDPAEWVHADAVEEPYFYESDAGWRNAGLLWGYWGSLEQNPLGADDFVRIDHVVVGDGWIPPPF